MVILMKFATCHVRNAFKRPLRPNAPTVRVLTSVISKGIGWTFRKLYPSKIPGMVHQGLLAPEGLKRRFDNLSSNYKNDVLRKRPITLSKLTTGGVSFQNKKEIGFANLINF